MTTTINTAPPPIPGEVLDPAPKTAPDKVQQIDQGSGAASTGVGVGYRSMMRFTHAQSSLLAGGTAYYLFLALFSIVPLAYGVALIAGADGGKVVTDALAEAFPGLLGDNKIDPDTLSSVGRSSSLVGVVGLLYGGTGAVVAATASLHLIYGAPKDPRNFALARARALMWLLIAGPLILVSYGASSLSAILSRDLVDSTGASWLAGPQVGPGAFVLSLLVNFAVQYLLLANLGGIRPERKALLIGAAVGAVVTEVLKAVMNLLIGFTVDNPAYGSFAAPIGVLFVLYLQAMTLYAAAALTAGIADRDVPLEVMAATDAGSAQDAVEQAAEDSP